MRHHFSCIFDYFCIFIKFDHFSVRCELDARANYITLYIHVTETKNGEFTPYIHNIVSYQVCCFVTNVVKFNC